MNAKLVRRGIGGYLVVESVLHDGLTAALGMVALQHGATFLGILAVAWAVTEVVVKVVAAVLLNRGDLSA